MKLLAILILLIICLPGYSQQKQTSLQLYDTVYTRPEVLASYPGGEKAWKRYLKKHLKYPRKAWWDEVESEVSVKLIIEKDGTISNASHLTISNYGFEQEAVRVVKQSGKWIPAKHKGQTVKSEGKLTIPFRLR
jgi:periplasmic protein TonB